MKKFTKLMLLGVFAIGVTTGCGCKKKEEKDSDKNKPKDPQVQANTETGVIEDKELGVFKFENTSLTYDQGNSFLETTVTNNSDEVQNLEGFWIHVKDKDGKEIVTLEGFFGGTLAAHESKVISSTYGDNLINVAKEITYEIKKMAE